MSLVARLEQIEPAVESTAGPERVRKSRRANRRALRLTAFGEVRRGDNLAVVIQDISPNGMLLEVSPGQLTKGDELQLELPETGIVEARVVWTSGVFCGCQFSEDIPTAAVSAALLKSDHVPLSGPADRDLGSRAGAAARFEPEVNFSVAMGMSLAAWTIIGAAFAALLLV